MRTLNVKLTVILLVGLILVAGSAHLLHSYQVQRNASSFKVQAKAAWNDDPRRAAEAVRLMRTYLLSNRKITKPARSWVSGLPTRPAHVASLPGRIGASPGEAGSAGHGREFKRCGRN